MTSPARANLRRRWSSSLPLFLTRRPALHNQRVTFQPGGSPGLGPRREDESFPPSSRRLRVTSPAAHDAVPIFRITGAPESRPLLGRPRQGTYYPLLDIVSGELIPPERYPWQGAPRRFISYARGDEPFKDALEQHLAVLKRQGLVESWHDR